MNGSGFGKLTKSMKLSVLGGAGVSAECGIPTFRGADGLWADETILKIATPHGFIENPQRSWEFYNKRRGNMAVCDPNPAHYALAALENAGFDVSIITQNIDGLHALAGSENILEVHGTVWKIKCTDPHCLLPPFENRDVPMQETIPTCEICSSPLRPDVVFFGEMLDPMVVDAADRRSKESDIMLVIGTSGLIYPAAGFAQIAKMAGAYVIEMNLDTTPLTPICDETILGPCGETLPKLISDLTNGEVA